jgi:hypothetical protein
MIGTMPSPKEKTPRLFLSSSTEEAQEEEEQAETVPGAIESDEIPADMSSESEGEQQGLVTIRVTWKGQEHTMEVPPRIRHDRLCQRVKRQLGITGLHTLKYQTRMSTATRVPGETIRVIEYVKIRIRSRGKIIEAPIPKEMRESEIHAMAHQYMNWGAEKTRMRVQEAHEDGHWKEDEEITIEAAPQKVHLEL